MTDPRIEAVEVAAFTIPTETPEQDGTLDWDSTTLLVAEVRAGGVTGLGYGYGDPAAADLARRTLAPLLTGLPAVDTRAGFDRMVRAVRNIGRSGIAMAAISTLDTALWDLKARLLGLPLFRLIGAARDRVPAYGSGGFTSFDAAAMTRHLEGFLATGVRAVKIKVGRAPEDDPDRMAHARGVIGPDVDLMIDANGALTVPHALALADAAADVGVVWFEEPVSGDDLSGLARLCREGPAGMDVAAGEYGDGPIHFRRMLEAGAVDVLQPDATRCGGVTGFLQAVALADAFGAVLSAHTAPTLHAHLALASRRVRHVEYFYDHARIEALLFDGALAPVGGDLVPATDRPGLGLTLRRDAAARFAV